MFAGLLGLDCHNKSLLHLSEGKESPPPKQLFGPRVSLNLDV